MALDQLPIVIPGSDFDGLWDRGYAGNSEDFTGITCPKNGFTESKEVRYFPWGVKTRNGYGNIAINAAWTTIRQVLAYATNDTSTSAVRSGFLVVSGNDVYDSASPTPGTSIHPLSVVGSYISIITVFGRIYITEHNLNTGVGVGTFVYFPGTGVIARISGGNATALGAASFVSFGGGNVTQGMHIFGVTFETNSGHIMAIAAQNVAAFTLAGDNQQVRATNIPLGPAGTTKRHILASKVITGFSGDPTDYEIFFVAVINDNVATTLDFNFTDDSLVDTNSADYLYDLFGNIFGGVGFCWYSNRMIQYGEQYQGGASLGPSILRVSEKGKPEAFSLTAGVVDVFRDDGQYGIKNAFEQDGLLVICKENKTYVVRDNGGDPNTWDVVSVDNAVGSVAFGVTKTTDTTGAVKAGKTIVAGGPGIYLFQGQYIEKPLTWKIERRWKTIAEDPSYRATQIVDIPKANLFVVAVNNTNSGNATQFFLIADYSRGLDWQNIRWTEWHPSDPTVFMTLKDPTHLYFCFGGAGIRSFTLGSNTDYNFTNDNGVTITGCEIITSELKYTNQLDQFHISGIRIRGKAFQSPDLINVIMEAGDDAFAGGPPITPTPCLVPYTSTPTPEILKGILNVSGYYSRLRFTWSKSLLEIRHIVIFGKVTAMDKLTV